MSVLIGLNAEGYFCITESESNIARINQAGGFVTSVCVFDDAMGRGEYYRNKYGGGGRGRGGGGGGGYGGRGGDGGFGGGRRFDRDDGGGYGQHRGGWKNQEASAAYTTTWSDLASLLVGLDNRNYNAYHELERTFVYEQAPLRFQLGFDHIQGDPYASPSRAHVTVDAASAGFPAAMYTDKIRNVALCDYLTRRFADAARRAGADAKQGTKKMKQRR